MGTPEDEQPGTAGDGVDDFWGVIPAGGAGTRLWPLSREAAPKFLLDLTGSGRTLLQQTVDRLAALCDHRLIVVTGQRHEDAVHRQLPDLPRTGVIAEPARRDSMAAIGLAAAVIERHHPDAVIGSFAADHVIADTEAFHATVREAIALARQDWVVTIGIHPTEPATGFGYIHLGEPLQVPGAPHGVRVREFVEKPDRATAQRYLQTGDYRWNAGMFVVRARVLLDLLAQYRPALADGLRSIAAEPDRLEQVWEGLERIAIDHAVAEPAAAAGRVAVVPADFTWDDIGDFASLTGLLRDLAQRSGEAGRAPGPGQASGPDEASGPAQASGPGDQAGTDDLREVAASQRRGGLHVVGPRDLVLQSGSSGLVVPAGGRVVAVIGMENVVIVDTGDAILVTREDRAQDVKSMVDRLRDEGHPGLT